MRKYIYLSLGLMLASCSHTAQIVVTNDTELPRTGELVEVPVAELAKVPQPFVLTDDSGTEIPYQLTYDSLVVFQATVPSGSAKTYTVTHGTPAAVDTVCYGAFFPRRKDDLTWENDRSAYRAYGHALQEAGEHAYGYDIWTKSVPHPVVEKRYREAFAKIANFHEDHGEGMDVYTVGPTLGAGTAALLDTDGNILYPWCFAEYEILDNGPLRFTARLHYRPRAIGGDSAVTETRTIVLDAGSFVNRTTVQYDGLTEPTAAAAGIVVHRQNPEGYMMDPSADVLAVADLTDDADADHGVIYVGAILPAADGMSYAALPESAGDAIGHILARTTYTPGSSMTYYWGSGWSKGSMPDWSTWTQYLTEESARRATPLRAAVQ